MSSFEKSVKGATKIKNAPPKAKYIEHLLVATHSGEAGIAEVFRTLQYRLRDSTWTVVFKGLLTVHIMIREGAPDVTLGFIAAHRSVIAISSFTDAQTQGKNIRRYSNYLTERARAYRDTKTDWVRTREDRLGNLSVERGLLRETEVVLKQIMALLKCDLLDAEPETEITLAVFRLLVLDLLSLFKVLNQGMIAILSHFFEMSKPDAERAHNIYRAFTKCTEYVVRYLSVARMHEHSLGIDIPSLQHAPVNLGKQLEDYLNDDDFDVHRRQFLAEQQAKKASGRSTSGLPPKLTLKSEKAPPPNAKDTPAPAPAAKPVASASAPPANADLIDFFDSIEPQQPTALQMQATAQQPVATSVITQGLPLAFQQQQPGLMPQQTGFVSANPYGMPQQQVPAMPDFSMMQQQQQPQMQLPMQTGAPMDMFGQQQTGFQTMPQQMQQQQQQPMGFQPQQGLMPQQTGAAATNPFRQSMMPTGSPFGAQPFQPPMPQQQQQQSTNPFARSQGSSSPFQSAAPLMAQPTGTNPFARNTGSPALGQQQLQQQQQPQQLAPQPTGVTNPFRQGDFVNHNTGMGWQHNQTPIGGGFDQIPTVPVFPRPAQQTPWQQ